MDAVRRRVLSLYGFIKKYQLFCCFLFSVLVTVLSAADQNFLNAFRLSGLVFLFGFSILFLICRFGTLTFSETAWMAIFLLIYAAISGFIGRLTGMYSVIFLYGGIFLFLAAGVMIWRGRSFHRENLFTETSLLTGFIFLFGFFLRAAYVIINEKTQHTHDLMGFSRTEGHSGYILWFLKEKRLPDFDVRQRWQFYHPPLHHIIMAVVLGGLEKAGMPENSAFESLQMVTVFYAEVLILICYKLFRYFGLKGKALLFVFLILNVHPTVTIMSGCINNDILSAALMLGTLLSALYWYREKTEKRRWGYMLLTALLFGLAMLTKLSSYMIAVPVAILFLTGFFQSDRKKKKKIALQFVCFLLIAAPLSFFWSVRNYVRFGIPFTYVPTLPGWDQNEMYIGMKPLQRIFDFSLYQFSPKHIYFNSYFYKGSYNEFNPLTGILKSLVFGDFMYGSDVADLIYANLLFWSNFVIVVCSAAGILTRMIRHTLPRLSLAVAVGFMILNFYMFCFQYPFTCTMDIRYISLIIPFGLTGLGLLMQEGQEDKIKGAQKGKRKRKYISKCLRYILYTCGAVFCISSVLFYG